MDNREYIILGRRIRKAARAYLDSEDFDEFDTPILTSKGGEPYNPTFTVIDDDEVNCSEKVEADYKSLVDSPQLYKMLLSIRGFDTYYQIAHCFRPINHESNKANRMSEFTQIDVEFKVDDLEVLIDRAKNLIIYILHSLNKEAKVTIIDGLECRDKYGNDMTPIIADDNMHIMNSNDSKEDLFANEVSILFIKRMPLTNGERTLKGGLIPCHHIFALPSKEHMCASEERFEYKLEEILKLNNEGINNKLWVEDLQGKTTESFDIVINGIEVGGGDLRIMDAELLNSMMKLFNVDASCYQDYIEELGTYSGKQSGGFAIGIERFIMALTGCENIRETVTFSKNV